MTRDTKVHDRALCELLSRMPEPKLAHDRRRQLAAEVMAQADALDDKPRRSYASTTIVAVALAATIALVLVPRRAELARVASTATPHVDHPAATTAAPAPPRVKPPVVTPIAPEPSPGPVEQHTDEARGDEKRIDRSRSTFAGSGAKHRPTLEQQTLLEASDFQRGWQALREQHYDDAISAFDRATDPAVAEDAAFWAAVAAQRANRADARARFEQFLARFPESPRAASARTALDSLR